MEVLPGVTVAPQVLDTALGAVEFDLTGGDGPVVLASGGVGGVSQARVQLGWLDPAQYRLLSVSRPGYRGTPLSSGRGIAEQADLLAALLNVLGVERVAVVALSAGGPAGYLLAARHPDRVAALVAIDCVSGHHDLPGTAGPIAQAIFLSRWSQQLFRVIGRKRPAWLLREILRGTAHYTKQQLRAHIDVALRSELALAFTPALLDSVAPYGASKAGEDNDRTQFRRLHHLPVEQVRCPTLIVHGTHDADVMFADGVYAYEHIPGARRFWIEEGSHLGFWLGPHAVTAQAVAREFLDQHRPW
jgi:pimeloyl-ACP methyl ester carboxylesterase